MFCKSRRNKHIGRIPHALPSFVPIDEKARGDGKIRKTKEKGIATPAIPEKPFRLRLFFLIVKHTVAIALKVRVCDLLAELLAHTFGILVVHETAGAVSPVLFHGVFQELYRFFVFIQTDFH